ncbi:monovalent cation:H+ antiporter, CPA1 family [Paraburkholderia lycopersici]|uniref:Monovalent cation:H+ antiporter, CPA1 family n=2 Tax=Paraburkholderia lycopersici TaxID=416944 RepID=A0A1G6SHE5_9BURK|nr:monovalent cation:H+ antiporter, CPA1 family [Paraburkholderia lycopersici]
MLVAVLTSGAIVRALPWTIPLPLLQISLGFLIAGVFKGGVRLDPDVFFLLFLPPLLFLDGWRIPKDLLRRDKLGIFQLSVGLVIMTVVGAGYAIHWMIPSMPLAVAFALAAVISPTDPVAVAGITHRLVVPRRITSILEGEALFNDASGLVAFRIAVAAAMTGAFSLSSAAVSFLWVAGAGLASGAIVTSAITLIRDGFTKRFGEEPRSEVLLSLLIPFAAYLLAERIGASGILAAVAAGWTMSRAELSGRVSAFARTQRQIVWDMLQFALNGIMFVLLGEQLPGIFNAAARLVTRSGSQDAGLLLAYAILVWLMLAVLRFACIFGSVWLARIVRGFTPPPEARATPRIMVALSLGGVRGAVTLAGVMTLPLMLPNGGAFPSRDLAIFLAAAVIIISLVAATLGMPRLLNGVEPSSSSPHQRQREVARQAAHRAAANRVSSMLAERQAKDASQEARLYMDAVDQVLAGLHELLAHSSGLSTDDRTPVRRNVELTMRRAAIEASRDAIYKLALDHEISDEVARDMVRLLDLEEMRLP